MPERRRRAERHSHAHAECVYEHDVGEQMNPEAAADTSSPLPVNVVATNTGVRLACTMAAMIGLFAIFLCWQERESRVICRFAVQSAALTAIHATVGFAALLIGSCLSGIPYLGLIVTLMCWLFYIAVLILLIVLRIRLMEKAWQGIRCDLPAPIERLLERFY